VLGQSLLCLDIAWFDSAFQPCHVQDKLSRYFLSCFFPSSRLPRLRSAMSNCVEICRPYLMRR
jgi:hypothetical protein